MAPSAPPVGANSPSPGVGLTLGPARPRDAAPPRRAHECGTRASGALGVSLVGTFPSRGQSRRRSDVRARSPGLEALRQRIKSETMPANRPLQTDGHCSAFGRPCPPLNAGVRPMAERAEWGGLRPPAIPLARFVRSFHRSPLSSGPPRCLRADHGAADAADALGSVELGRCLRGSEQEAPPAALRATPCGPGLATPGLCVRFER